MSESAYWMQAIRSLLSTFLIFDRFLPSLSILFLYFDALLHCVVWSICFASCISSSDRIKLHSQKSGQSRRAQKRIQWGPGVCITGLRRGR